MLVMIKAEEATLRIGRRTPYLTAGDTAAGAEPVSGL
jgi:hypothetical protein